MPNEHNHPQTILTSAERDELQQLETSIERGKETFVEVGLALCRIRDGLLYRTTHRTFERYCEERWGFSRVQAHRLIEAANVVSLLPIGNTVSTESQARELAKVNPAKRVEVLETVRTSGRKLTAKAIREVSQPSQPMRQSSEAPPAKPNMRHPLWFCKLSPKKRWAIALHVLTWGNKIKLPEDVPHSELERITHQFLDAVKEANPESTN